MLMDIQLPGFQGVIDTFNSLLASSLISNYIFWFLGIALVAYLVGKMLKAFS
jgi:hypothetical protein